MEVELIKIMVSEIDVELMTVIKDTGEYIINRSWDDARASLLVIHYGLSMRRFK